MAKVSVLIPARNEQFLAPTVDSLFKNAAGDIEVIVHLDGYWPDSPLKDWPNLHVIHRPHPVGMRSGINACAAIASGEYLMKCDAHCLFDEGFDEVLQAEYDDNWVVVPRRHSLDAENWCIEPKQPKDYHYLSYPIEGEKRKGIHGKWWRARGTERANILLDDEMTSQGSCWFMSKRHFWDFLGGLQTDGYGDFIQEFQEIGMKTWLGGGQVKVNKKTWYAHLHKGNRYGRGYFIGRDSWKKGMQYSADLWLNNKWENRVHDFAWLVEKFMPIPGWPDDWEAQLGYA